MRQNTGEINSNPRGHVDRVGPVDVSNILKIGQKNSLGSSKAIDKLFSKEEGESKKTIKIKLGGGEGAKIDTTKLK